MRFRASPPIKMSQQATAIAMMFWDIRIPFLSCLTPELSRTAARNGGVVHVTMQPSREAVSA